MGGELIRDARNGPLCPQSYGWVQSPAHALKVRIDNARYRAQEPLLNEDGDLPEELDRVEAKVDEQVNDTMRLYRASDVGSVGGRFIRVEAYYWQCMVCGFTLPAQEQT